MITCLVPQTSALSGQIWCVYNSNAFNVTYTTQYLMYAAQPKPFFCHFHLSKSTQLIICSLSVGRMEREGKGRIERERQRADLLASSMVFTGLWFVSVWKLCPSHRHRNREGSHEENKTVGAPAKFRKRTVCGKRHPLQVASLPPLPAYI